jgi:arsenate reductase (glutaredoxin)
MDLLLEKGIELEIVNYLDTPPSKETLASLATKLGMRPRDLLRTAEAEFNAANLNLDTATDDEVLDLLVLYPKLIQRPIVESSDAARIGRPPESVLELFK